ncbi:MAG: CapA family protein [Planctomycetota bacterium]|jgi:poly-gamma-glutamate synthesis protein (capsule biosynthesis protein)
MPTVLIGGDVCPIGRNMEYFINGDVEGAFGELLAEFEKSDLAVVNLECPLIEKSTPIKKTGPVLGASKDCIEGIKKAGIDLVNMANNHIMDHGAEGFKSTISACQENGIYYVGAGNTLKEARKLFIRSIDGVRIGVLGFAEKEFSIATTNSCGANPLEIINYVRDIKEHRHMLDYLIVLVHGGKELYPYPTPRLMKVCRFMVEEGADAVICQHSHCAGCYESYKGSYIVYGQGNLIFDFPNKNKQWSEGFLVGLIISRNCQSQMKLIPYIQSYESAGARKMNEDEEKALLDLIDKRSDAIKKPEFVFEQWYKLCSDRRYEYLGHIRGCGRLMSYLNRKLHLTDYLFSKRSKRQVLNVIQCETHREILEDILRQRS